LDGAAPRAIDEWQLVRSLWNDIRNKIDTRNKKGQFIITGSSTPEKSKMRHTGTGRIARVRVKPFSLSELGISSKKVKFSDLFIKGANVSGKSNLSVKDYAKIIVIGGMPANINEAEKNAMIFNEAYLHNIVHTDLSIIDSPPDPQRMTGLISALARNISTSCSYGKLISESEILDTDFSEKTVRKYLDQLSEIFILEELPAYKIHLRSSIRTKIKAKWHFMDPFLAMASLGGGKEELLGNFEHFGLVFESLVLRDIRIYAQSMGAEVYYYGDATGLEIDIVVKLKNGKFSLFEVKLGSSEQIEEAAGSFKKFKNRLDKNGLKKIISFNVITGGEYAYTREDGVNVVPLGCLYP
jgi:predicted AAA+ superfamily ATPase